MIDWGRMRRTAVGAFLAGCLALTVGCTPANDSTTVGSATDAEIAAGQEAAERVVELAKTSLLYGPTTGLATPDELRAPEASDIDAFEYEPIDGPTPTAAIVGCATIAPACVHTAELIQAYLAKLDIDSEIVYSDYSPAGNQRAMNTALSKDPTAIFTIAVSPSTVGPQIERAKAAGIFVIDAVGTEETDGGDLDAYVPQGSNLFQIALAAQLALSIEGEGAVTWLDAPAFPELEVRAGTDFFKQVCPACSLTEDDVTAAQVTNPVTMGSLITSLMRSKPDTKYVTLASACADLQSAAAALRRTKGTLAAPGCGAAAIAAMNAGNLKFASGTIEPWGALAAVDQMLRLLSGEKPLPESDLGPAAYLVTPESTPFEGTTPSYAQLDQWAVSVFDFVTPYSEAWGVDLSDVIANEKD